MLIVHRLIQSRASIALIPSHSGRSAFSRYNNTYENNVYFVYSRREDDDYAYMA